MAHSIDLDKASATIRRFITGKLLESGLSGYVIGLSGGVDSALAATLAVKAVGADKLLALAMPYQTSLAASSANAKLLAGQLGIELRVIDITPMLNAYFDLHGPASKLRIGNKAARERMSILFDIASDTGRLVLGTSNRTEFCLGYTTWFGDSAASINPLAELYKTEVLAMARALEIPDQIVDQPPTADLWPGQTDEDELGVRYAVIDRILARVIDDGETSMGTLQAEGLDMVDISKVVSLVNRNAFKRKLPAIAPIGRDPVPDRIQIAT